MPERLVILVSSVAALTSTWTTVHLAQAAAALGMSVRVAEVHDWEVSPQGVLAMKAWSLVPGDLEVPELARRLSRALLPRVHIQLREGDLLLVRINPLRLADLPMLLMARDRGVQVVNDPLGLAATRSKAWLAGLPDVPTPPTLVTRSRGSARAFAQDLGTPVIVKPAIGSGGLGVHLVPAHSARLLERTIDMMSLRMPGPFVIQGFVEEATQGEKRLVWVDGQLLGAYLRHSAPGDFRHNLKQGGLPSACALEASDHRLASAIGPHLVRNGIRIAGLDVMGDQLIEVNTLNPGGIHHAERLRTEPGPRIADIALKLLLDPPPAVVEEPDR